MQGNTTEIDERNLLRLDALLSHGYGLSPQLVMRSKGLSIEAKALYGYLSSFAGAGDTAFPSTSRILEELDISKNRFYKIRKELVSWGFISIETTATSAGLRTVYTLPQNPIAIKTEIDEIANRRNEIKSSLVANLHNEDMVSHKGDSESERLQQSAGNEPCRQSEAKAQNRGSNLKPCLQSEDEGCLQSGDKLYIDTNINPKVSIDRSAAHPSDDEGPSDWKVTEGMTDPTQRDDGESDRDANRRDALDAVPDGTYDPLPTVADGYTLSNSEFEAFNRLCSLSIKTVTNYTQRNFIMGLGAMDERGGITFTIFPAHVKGFSRVLNASGGRNYLEQAARNRTAPSSTQTLQLYGDDNTIAGRFWVTKSVDKNGRYNIISDASGFAFDQTDGKTAEGTIVRLYSDGNNGSEWSNEAHKWRIEEVFFKGTISLDAERVEPGKTISVIDPSKTCTPYDQGGTGSVKYLYRWYWMKDERESPFAENKYPEAFTLSSWCHLANCGDQIWRDAYAGAGYPVRDTNFFVEAFKLRIKYGNGFIENNADFGAICYAGCMGIENSGDFSWSDVCRDGEELGKGGVSNRITGIKIWLEGDIAKEYDIAYRAFIYGQGWTERFHSNGGSQDDAELCGSDDASGSKGAIKCIQVFAIPKPRGAKLAREFAEDNSFIPENSHSGGYLTAQAMLALNLDDTSGFDGHKMIVDAYQGDSSKGLEALPVPPTPPLPVGIKVFYYVDGETDPCFEEERST